jgi:hypothetical protein
MIEGVEIHIRPELAGQIPNRQAARAQRSEKIVARKIYQLINFAQHSPAAFQDALDQPAHVWVWEQRKQDFHQHSPIEAGEELPDVTLQEVPVAAGKTLGTVQGAVGALANPVGIGVWDEQPLEDRLDQIAQSMVHHPIAEGGGRDQAPLGLVNVEAGILPRLVGKRAQLLLQLDELIFQAIFESRHVGVAALAFTGAPVGQQEIVPGTQLCIHRLFYSCPASGKNPGGGAVAIRPADASIYGVNSAARNAPHHFSPRR